MCVVLNRPNAIVALLVCSSPVAFAHGVCEQANLASDIPGPCPEQGSQPGNSVLVLQRNPWMEVALQTNWTATVS